MPGLALYRISTAVSRGMKVMQHDIYSRGMTEPIATTLAFLLAFAVGFKESSPEVAAILDGGVRIDCARTRLDVVSQYSSERERCVAFRRSTLANRACCPNQRLSAD